MEKTIGMFSYNQIRSKKKKKQQEARDAMKDESQELILTLTEDEYAERIVGKYGFEPVSVNYDNAYLESWSSPREEKQVFLPAAGNLELLRYDPDPRVGGTKTYSADITDDGYRVKLDSARRVGLSGSEKIEARLEETLEGVREKHENLEEVVEEFHERLREMARNQHDTRKTEIERQQAIQDDIDFPVRRRDDVAEALNVERPEKREEIRVEELRDPSEPTWRIPDEAYEEIMDTMNSLGAAFERRPGLFEDNDEEDMRDHMLFYLEENFVGSTSGETFNKDGKTDVMLQTDDGPVFVAECAIWNGPKTVTDKIDQLIGDYLTWRDSKAAVILFVANEDMPRVLEKIPGKVESHPQFVSAEGQKDESWWQYRFELPDSSKEVDLGVQAYHIPTLR